MRVVVKDYGGTIQLGGLALVVDDYRRAQSLLRAVDFRRLGVDNSRPSDKDRGSNRERN